MSALEDLQLQISNGEAAICDEFNVATERNPWNRLPAAERINFLRHMIRPLAQIAVAEGSDRKVYLRALHIAAHHGERRHVQGLPDSIVFEDLSFFRWAVCRRIPTNAGSWYLEAVGRIDRLLTLASAAALRGYHREVFEARGEWPDVLEGLLGREAPAEERGGRKPWRSAAADAAWPTGEIDQLTQGFVADARQWLHRIRMREPAGQELDDRLVRGLLDEYAGALDLLDVLREELAAGTERGPSSAEALVLDSSSSIQFANRAAVESLGYSAHELHGTTLLALLHPEDRPRMTEILGADPEAGATPVQTRIRIRRPGGSWLTVDLTVRPLLLSAGSRRFLVRGRVADVMPGESVESGWKGEYFKRYTPRRPSIVRPPQRPEIGGGGR